MNGAALHAVIETNPQVLAQAAALDAERKVKGSRRPLHGIPLLLKDNIATLHEEGESSFCASCRFALNFHLIGLNTTAGMHLPFRLICVSFLS